MSQKSKSKNIFGASNQSDMDYQLQKRFIFRWNPFYSVKILICFFNSVRSWKCSVWCIFNFKCLIYLKWDIVFCNYKIKSVCTSLLEAISERVFNCPSNFFKWEEYASLRPSKFLEGEYVFYFSYQWIGLMHSIYYLHFVFFNVLHF